MPQKYETDILIIGAGPSGLMAANQLQRHNVNFIIIDTKGSPTLESRALGVSARSMELYQQLGLDEEVQKQAIDIKGFQLYSNGKIKADVNVEGIGEGQSDFQQMLTIFEQNKNEKLLYENIKRTGKDVLWNTEFIELTEKTEYLIAKICKQKENSSIKCKYIIGCDGASSMTRHQMNFSFDGGTYENKFFVADTTLSNDFDHDKIFIAPSDDTFTALFPMQGKNKYRIIGTLPLKYAANENVSFADIEENIQLSSKLNLQFKKVNWFSTYKLHHRCVKTFNKGRVFLAGDSAHIHSPAGGQGMNTGLQDAHNLCWKLAYVLKGYAKEELLNTYNEERLPFARWLLKSTDRGFSIMSSRQWVYAKFRKYIVLNFIGYLFKINSIRPRIYKVVSQTWYSYSGKSLSVSDSKQDITFKSGDRLPYIEERFFTHFREAGFHLLHVANKPFADETVKEINTLLPFPIKVVERQLQDGWKHFGVVSELVILIRPDLYICYISDEYDKTQLKEYFKSKLLN